MNTLEIDLERLEPVSVRCDASYLHVTLGDGVIITTPLWWYPRLLAATPEDLAQVELSPFGIHWPTIDEDLSITGLIEGRKAPGATPPAEAAE
ncbi:DUF2442 domain-containing protein [Hoeflea ulvae]|uniref:DUF2442 domain-containing protein n=1 Tax=Hoeflea ulvae TaxID=2983764 RepID=A0ABT3YBS2_9HYPH|nr:DUF2442 domain-containing protein [Hoeflea ulvae]MCY0093322.1 DUF2442 domain-containing protein [Hoeflea ulvae]